MQQTELPALPGHRICRLKSWQPWPYPEAGLLGHATVTFQGGWTICRVPVFRKGDGLSVGVPSSPIVDKEGNARWKDGKRQYQPVVEFDSADAKERWSRAILGALADAGVGGGP